MKIIARSYRNRAGSVPARFIGARCGLVARRMVYRTLCSRTERDAATFGSCTRFGGPIND